MFETGDDDATPLERISIAVAAEPAATIGVNDESGFVDNYRLSTGGDNEQEDDFSLSEKMVHYLGGHVSPEHWTACKAVLVFYAGAETCKLSVMTKQGKEAACLAAYNAAIDSLDPTYFCANAIKFFRHSFKKKDEPMTAYPLYRYFSDSRRDMRAALIPLFPRNFHSMRSGKGFHDTCNEVFVSAYRRELVTAKGFTEEAASQELPPQFWEYKKIPWCFSLTVKIFRKHPQLAPDVGKVLADKSNATISRAVLKREKQLKRMVHHSSLASSKSAFDTPVATSSVHSSCTKTSSNGNASKKKIKTEPGSGSDNRLVWAKVHTARAVALQSNVAKRVGKVKELETMLDLLDRMRPVIGDIEYAKRVTDLAASMPNPSSYNTDVDVIVLDADDDDNNPAVG